MSDQLSEASSEMNEIALNYIYQDSRLQSFRQKIQEKAKTIGPADRQWVDDLLESLDKEIKQDEYWNTFEAQFNKSHDNFIKRLKKRNKDLSRREMRICAYIRMGMDNHEIAEMMDITVRDARDSSVPNQKKTKPY